MGYNEGMQSTTTNGEQHMLNNCHRCGDDLGEGLCGFDPEGVLCLSCWAEDRPDLDEHALVAGAEVALEEAAVAAERNRNATPSLPDPPVVKRYDAVFFCPKGKAGTITVPYAEEPEDRELQDAMLRYCAESVRVERVTR